MEEWSLSENWWQLIVVAISCYLIGCINFARLISRSKNKDITKIGSGNPGTMNMTREFGVKVGLITFFCDAFKGGLPSLIGMFIYLDQVFAGTDLIVADFMRYYCGVFVIIGHIFPVTMHFKGGKGIASTLGLFWINLACENPWFLLIGFGFLLFVALYIVFTEWGAMGSLIGVTGFSVWQGIIFYLRYTAILASPLVLLLFGLLMTLNILTWCAHGKNIIRLLSGEEHRTSVKAKLRKKKS
ncbi:MAG: glycerol-3-phosphate acyltransferase [Clostridia bacterium]|nr:glycerol-3-phosphate acyltransferase [Clostridia bacterium]